MSADSLTSYLRELRSRSLGDYGQPVEGFTVAGDKATPIIELGARRKPSVQGAGGVK